MKIKVKYIIKTDSGVREATGVEISLLQQSGVRVKVLRKKYE